MAETSRAKLKELLGRHSELEQSETKAQAALVTILSLTQITELKLLLDIGRQGHRFYDFVLTLLVACVSLEIFIGVIIIYIGNLHYYQTIDGVDRVTWSRRCRDVIQCCRCLASSCRGRRKTADGGAAYETVLEPESGAAATAQPSPVAEGAGGAARGILGNRGGGTGGGGHTRWALLDMNRLDVDVTDRCGGIEDGHVEFSRVRVADAEVRIIRAGNYVKVLEEASRKSAQGGGQGELDEELGRAREELAAAMREKEESEAEQRLTEVYQRRSVIVKEGQEDRRERLTFRKISFWQHLATYLLYFVMLMNVFITTFGISGGGAHNVFVGGHHLTMTTSAQPVVTLTSTTVTTTPWINSNTSSSAVAADFTGHS